METCDDSVFGFGPLIILSGTVAVPIPCLREFISIELDDSIEGLKP